MSLVEVSFITLLNDDLLPLYELCEDIPKYVWACLMKKRCAVCGKKAELHHVDAIGAGRNRKEIPQIGMQVLPLCRVHHNEIHNIGKLTFLKKYILQSIALTKDIAKIYKLTKKNMEVRTK
ncbi:putative HNHc nuclease [Megamonas funiformis]|uniref:putative HNHc nuclease n=1 Tax=Megamonas funiformis TaxID=437897 RepID=UPI003566B002